MARHLDGEEVAGAKIVARIIPNTFFTCIEVVQAAIAELRGRHETVPLVVGNVATDTGARRLADMGVDAIKVGVGPGRGCRPRAETGAVDASSEIPEEDYVTPIGKAKVRREGNDVTIIATLLMMHRSLQAADALEKEGISA